MSNKGYQCEVILDSVSASSGVRIITMRLKYPLLVHQDMLRHELIRRSVASNRAIPASRMIQRVATDMFIPDCFGQNQSGMSPAKAYPVSSEDHAICRHLWKTAATHAVSVVNKLVGFETAKWTTDGTPYRPVLNVHKELANRLLAPFLWVVEVVTATDFDNFYALRIHPAAQRQVQIIAELMYRAQQASAPQILKPGQWHIPFLSAEEKVNLKQIEQVQEYLKVSAARCARTSFETHDKKPPVWDQDLALYDRLMGGTIKHVSPTEHQALCMESSRVSTPCFDKYPLVYPVFGERRYGCYRGWVPFRFLHPNHVIEDVESFWEQNGGKPVVSISSVS